MNLREDTELLEIIDKLALGNRENLEMLLNRLFFHHWNEEIGQPQAVLVALVDFVNKYSDTRLDMDISTSIDTATAHILNNPNIQKLMAELMQKSLGGRFQ
tara:strand:+ start:874 stop:1176 length:303 start_codon:yes stop_codon:yes gene_type:complete